MADSDPTRHDPTWQEIDDEARQRRIEALRSIAAHTPQTPADTAKSPVAVPRPSPSLSPPPRRSPRPRATWLAAGSLVLAVVVIAVLVLSHLRGTSTAQRQATPASPSGPLVIRPALNELGCPTAAAWSGDGTQIAVVGTTTCDEQFGQGLLDVYNFPAGKLIAKFQLDDVIAHATGLVNLSNIQTLSVFYTHVLWLGPAIYVTFQVTNTTATTNETKIPFVGLLRANPSDTTAFAFVQPTSERLDVYTRWNPVTGQAKITPDAIVGSNGNVFATLPPSLAYGWGEGGNPIALAPLAAGPGGPGDPGGPIGDPASNARLTIWQPGFVAYTTGQGAAGVYVFSTDFAAVSGGQPFLFDAMHVQGVLVPSGQPAPDRKSLATLHLSPAPWLPVRDAALQAVINALPTFDTVAWRPDGAVLAAHAGIPFDQNGMPRTTDITFYGTATGHVLGTVTPPGASSRTLNPLLWAPDGRALLMLDQEADTLVIWSQAQLPH